MQPQQTNTHRITPLQRIRIWYALLVVVIAVFVVRAFYLQVIRHDYYEKTAMRSQLKQYEIPASRGVISAYTGDSIVPLVLNETIYELFADPKFITNQDETAKQIHSAIGGNIDTYKDTLKNPPSPRYAILAKKLNREQADAIKKLDLIGVGTRESQRRTYPDGSLAAQALGFVNDEGQGTYGIEQVLNLELTGTPGQLKAITDAQGVPLPASSENVIKNPIPGKHVLLTLDIAMQQHLEDVLQTGLKKVSSPSGSAFIIDVKTGAIKAMASYPTYEPAKYFEQDSVEVFNNSVSGDAMEVGSIAKLLSMTAAIDSGAVSASSTYYDPGVYNIDGAKVTNVDGSKVIGTHSVQEILTRSYNTGATWLLMQMGGGSLNESGRKKLYDYYANRFLLGSPTGIEQNIEGEGYIPAPDVGYGLNLQYANMSFGQGFTATTLQMGAAMAAVLNGGTYYKPHLVDGYIDPTSKKVTKLSPEITKRGVVKPSTGTAMTDLMKGVYDANWKLYTGPEPTDMYMIGGKTGTAEIPNPEGGYFTDKTHGTFLGYVGGDRPQYVIVVRANEPKLSYGYAGAGAAAPIFGEIVRGLLGSGSVTPKGQ